jgi:hypothetical protein
VLDVNGDGFASVVVGAYHAMSNTGRVHVYLGSAAGLSSTGPDGANSAFGISVASRNPFPSVRHGAHDSIERPPRSLATPVHSAPARC